MNATYLAHVGLDHTESKVGPGSGRYHYGSGENPFQHQEDVKTRIARFENEINPDTGKNYTRSEIIQMLGYSTETDIMKAKGVDRYNKDIKRYNDIINYIDKCQRGENGRDPYTPSKNEIAKAVGEKNESNIRSALNPDTLANLQRRTDTLNYLMDAVEGGKFLDIGKGCEHGINGGITDSLLDACVFQLQNEQGYQVHKMNVQQVGTGKNTTVTVLTEPNIEWSTVAKNQDNIVLPEGSLADPSKSADLWKMEYPASIDSSRIYIDYAKPGEEVMQDGLTEIRRGVPDLYLGDGVDYAQVRIAVDDSKYIKGMAVYSDNIPDGYDLVVHSNKFEDGSNGSALKSFVPEEERPDPINPFGAAVMKNGQSTYIDPVTGEEKLSAINKINQEGSWNEWSRSLASQFWSKQTPELAQQQLDLAYLKCVSDFDTIKQIQQPEIKQYLLDNLASTCDAHAVDLDAAALPGQTPKVIIPIPSIKDGYIYDPDLPDGTIVSLVRFPHAGRFEIPTLVVDNANEDARSMLGNNAPDAVAINAHTAEYLSGADFDGDTVLVIPNNDGAVKTMPRLEGLIGFNANQAKELGGYEFSAEEMASGSARLMKKSEVGREMGVITNLITDMSFHNDGSPEFVDDLTNAVRHSMVIIDAYKHKLDYKKSEVDHDISEIKAKYQRRIDPETGKVLHIGGASSIFSKAGSEMTVPLRTDYPTIDEKGNLVWREETRDKMKYYDKKEPVYERAADGKHYVYDENHKKVQAVDENGNPMFTWSKSERFSKSTPMDEAKTDADIDKLVGSNSIMERLAADYAKKMKQLARDARLESKDTKSSRKDPEAATEYADEVASLKAKINEAEKNAPRERQAQILANSMIRQERQQHPEAFEDKDKVRKFKARALDSARAQTGASKDRIKGFSDREWDAIMKGAFNSSEVRNLLNQSTKDAIVKRATPNTYGALTPSQLSAIRYMLNTNSYSNAEIAREFGVSTSTIGKIKSNRYTGE